jgi:hypothetical protein
MAIVDENMVVFREAWGHILSLLFEIHEELKSQTGDETGQQINLEQSPRQSKKSQKRKELGQGQRKEELLRSKLSELMVQAQAILKDHGHNVELGIE